MAAASLGQVHRAADGSHRVRGDRTNHLVSIDRYLAATGDTYLDPRGWSKGTVWVNGHHLGRFWSIGPQQTLYVPGPWLRTGANDVVVFSLAPPQSPTLAGVTAPVFELAPVK